MKIAITGGSGFIGTWILREFSDQHDFIVLGRKNSNSKIKINKKTIKYIHTDYSCGDLIKHLNNMEAVIHLATKRPEIKEDDTSFQKFLPNVTISTNLFEACKTLKINNIINASSRSIYGKRNLSPFTEDQTTFPDTPYGLSKKIVENIAYFYNEKYNMMIKSLRFAEIFGLGEKKDRLCTVFLQKAYKKQEIPIFGLGASKREYIYIKDVILSIIGGIKKKEVSGIFNIGHGQLISIKDLVNLINEIFDNQNNLIFLPTNNNNKKLEFLMSSNNAYKQLNWQSKWDYSSMLKDIKKDIIKYKYFE